MNRERVLLVAFVLGAGGFLAYWGYNTQIAGRFEEKQKKISKARKSVQSKKEIIIESRAAQLDLAEWEKLSLPPDPNTAIPQYQAFLLDLLEQSGFQDPTITPRPAAMRDETYLRLSFDVQARGSMQSLVTFLDAFHRVQILHKLGRLSLTPLEREGRSVLDLRFGVEALALVTDATEDLAEGNTGTEYPAESVGSSPFPNLLTSNLLMRQGPGPNVRPEHQAAQVYLTGTIVTSEKPEALFFNRATGESLVLNVGDSLAIGDFRGELVDVSLSEVVFDLRGNWHTLALGENLSRRKPLTDADMIARTLDASRPDATITPP